jgi:hypothetical protein
MKCIQTDANLLVCSEHGRQEFKLRDVANWQIGFVTNDAHVDLIIICIGPHISIPKHLSTHQASIDRKKLPALLTVTIRCGEATAGACDWRTGATHTWLADPILILYMALSVSNKNKTRTAGPERNWSLEAGRSYPDHHVAACRR